MAAVSAHSSKRKKGRTGDAPGTLRGVDSIFLVRVALEEMCRRRPCWPRRPGRGGQRVIRQPSSRSQRLGRTSCRILASKSHHIILLIPSWPSRLPSWAWPEWARATGHVIRHPLGPQSQRDLPHLGPHQRKKYSSNRCFFPSLSLHQPGQGLGGVATVARPSFDRSPLRPAGPTPQPRWPSLASASPPHATMAANPSRLHRHALSQPFAASSPFLPLLAPSLLHSHTIKTFSSFKLIFLPPPPL